MAGLLVHLAYDVNEIGDLRSACRDSPMESDGLLLADGLQPFHHLKIAASDQPIVREQVENLASGRS